MKSENCEIIMKTMSEAGWKKPTNGNRRSDLQNPPAGGCRKCEREDVLALRLE